MPCQSEMDRPYVVLRKVYQALHGRGAFRPRTLSITTGQPQDALLDEKEPRDLLRGQRVLLLDDVISHRLKPCTAWAR